MRNTEKIILALAACGAIALGASPAEAKVCIKGAVVGGVAGHMAGHGVMGAAGGCVVGHHMANRPTRDAERPPLDQHNASGYGRGRS